MRIATWIALMGLVPFTGKAGLALPPAPSPVVLTAEPGVRNFRSFLTQDAVPLAPPKAPEVARRKTADLTFWSLTGLMVASTVANAQSYVNCGNCTVFPSTLHRSGVVYGLGMPLDVGFACVGYYLKKHDHRWWFAPGAAFAGGNTYLAYHWASRTEHPQANYSPLFVWVLK